MEVIEIEKLRQFNESNEQWARRRAFLTHNWTNEQVVPLSWCYANMMTLGTTYPNETMAQLKNMIPDQPPKTAPPRSSLIPSRRRRRLGQAQTPPLTTTTPPTPTKPKTVLEIVSDLEIAALRAKSILRYDSFQLGYGDTYDAFVDYLQGDNEIINENKPDQLDSDDWVSLIYIDNIELGFGIAPNQSRAAACARQNALYRIKQQCVIGTRLYNTRKVAQLTLGTADQLDLGYLPPKPALCSSTENQSLSTLTRHITEKVKDKKDSFLELIAKENKSELIAKQELTQREEIKTRLYINNQLIGEELGGDKVSSEAKARNIAMCLLKTCEYAPHYEEKVMIDLTDDQVITVIDDEEDEVPLWKSDDYLIPLKWKKRLKVIIPFVRAKIKEEKVEVVGGVTMPDPSKVDPEKPPAKWLKFRHASKYETKKPVNFSLKEAETTVAKWGTNGDDMEVEEAKEEAKVEVEEKVEVVEKPKEEVKKEVKLPTLDEINASILAEKQKKKRAAFLSEGELFAEDKKDEEKSKPEVEQLFKTRDWSKTVFGFGNTKPPPVLTVQSKGDNVFGFGQKPNQSTSSLTFSFATKEKPKIEEPKPEPIKMPDLASFLKPMDQPITDDEKRKIVEVSSSSSDDSDSDSDSSDSNDDEPILITIKNGQSSSTSPKEKPSRTLNSRSHFKSGSGLKMDLAPPPPPPKSSPKKRKKKKITAEIETKVDNLQKILRSYPASFDSLPRSVADLDEKLDFVEFTLSSLLSDFEAFMKTDAPRLNQARFGELKASDKCCLVRMGQVELGMGLGKDGKRARGEALASIDARLRYTKQYVVYAKRYVGLEERDQLTLSPSPKSLPLGYLPPLKVDNDKERTISSLSDITLFLRDKMTDSHSVIQRTASLNQIQVEFTISDAIFGAPMAAQFRAELSLGGVLVAKGHGMDKKLAKRDAADKALVVMKEKCKVVHERVQQEVVSLDDVNQERGGSSMENAAKRMKSDKGAVLMKLMGWKGGGIGKEQQGRLDPVEHNQARTGWDKSCIGLDDRGAIKVNREKAELLVARYAKSDIMEDLAFSSELGSGEREIIHKVARKFGLRSKSYGKGADRHLVIGRHPRQKMLHNHHQSSPDSRRCLIRDDVDLRQKHTKK